MFNQEKRGGRIFSAFLLLLLFFVPSLSAYAETANAIDAAREAVKADPENADAHERLGYLLIKQGQYDEALRAFNRALEINPRLRTARTGKGLSLFKKGDAKGAEPVLKEALMLNPYPSMTYYSLGLVYESLNEYEKAIVQFKEGIKKFKTGKR